MSYQQQLKTHLAEYKRSHLGINEPGIFRYRGNDLQRDHILPLAEERRNLLDEAELYARAFLAENRLKRHRYFHHLNSSQAFAFNLFFPYFYGGQNAAAALLRAFGQQGVFVECEPEAVPALDEGSNIDMRWTTDDKSTTFCEVKLSETDFGKAVDDDRHRDKLQKCYAPILAAHLEPSRMERQIFFEAYQFNRNVWHMVRSDQNRLVFLLPRANTVLWSLLQNLLLGVVPSTRKRIDVVAIEDVLNKLSADDRCPTALREYSNKLKRKYIIQNATSRP